MWTITIIIGYPCQSHLLHVRGVASETRASTARAISVLLASILYPCRDHYTISPSMNNLKMHAFAWVHGIMIHELCVLPFSPHFLSLGACFSKVHPTPVKNPKLVGHSLSALSLLSLSQKEVAREDFLQYFSGSKILPGSEPAAHCYCGHQFGYFSGQLGDGCAM